MKRKVIIKCSKCQRVMTIGLEVEDAQESNEILDHIVCPWCPNDSSFSFEYEPLIEAS